MKTSANKAPFRLVAVLATDGGVLLLALGGCIRVSPLSVSLLNVAIVIMLGCGKTGPPISQMKSLPALAAAGTIVLQTTGSQVKLIELLSESTVGGVGDAFRTALHLCYRGEGVDDALAVASEKLPYQGMKKGIGGLQRKGRLETVKSEAGLSGLDLERYYLKALGTYETRTSLMQGLAFFLPILALISYPRFFSGPFDALALVAFAFATLRYVASLSRS